MNGDDLEKRVPGSRLLIVGSSLALLGQIAFAVLVFGVIGLLLYAFLY